MTTKILILGASGGCLDVIDLIQDINAASNKEIYKILGLLEDDYKISERKKSNYEVIGSFSDVKNFDADVKIVNAIGSEKSFYKKKNLLLNELNISFDKFETLVHPSAIISENVEIRAGAIIYQGVSIGRNCFLGLNSILLPNSFIGHDTKIGDFSIINAGCMISGNVSIGESSYLGGGTKIKPYVSIGENVLIGMGSLVTKDLNKNSINYGCPTKKIKNLF